MRIIGALCGLVLAAAAGFARADTVVIQQAGTTSALDLQNVSLPGAGAYRFEVQSSKPVSIAFDGHYTFHWDIFVAPPPRPHEEFIEGNDADVFSPFNTTAAGATWTFTVPETVFTFFDADQTYEDFFGVPKGTPLYREDKYEDPSFYLLVGDFGSEETFDYTFRVTRLAAVPEPSGWAIMILGFVAVGLAARRRGRVALHA